MQLKYPKPLRIPHSAISARHDKRYLNPSEVKRLLKGDTRIEEKIDGSQMSIAFKNGKPVIYTRNRHLSEYDKCTQFKGAWPWVWTNIEKVEGIPRHTRVVGEWAHVQHNIVYDRLPDRFIAFDIIEEGIGRIISQDRKIKILNGLGFTTAPVMFRGKVKFDDLLPLCENKRSAFSTVANMEGIVVKADTVKQFGKLVVQEFLDDLAEESHWTGRTPRFNVVMA